MKINRLKVMLIEKGKTNKWLAEKLGKSDVTVSRWVTNEVQPSMETLLEIAQLFRQPFIGFSFFSEHYF
jgi:transcriptional regulator with XRE-family HTH domain